MNGRLRLLLAILLVLPPPCLALEVVGGKWIGDPDAMKRVMAERPTAPEVAFSPHGGALELVVRTIESAKSSIRVAAYGFTSKPIAVALLDAHKRGVDVKVVVDKSNPTARYTAATFLANQGVPVRADYRYAIMHNKFVVVDGQVVETGSFNFSAAAEAKNAENVIVLHDPTAAQRYGQEWERLWGESEGMGARY